jgi:hypothetical protein
MANDNLADKIAAVRQLTDYFKLERYVYVGIISLCLGLFLVSVAVALFRGKMGPVEITSLLSSGGGVTVMIGRLLNMWNRAMTLLDGRQ